jgi:hypothetical protein
MAVRGGGPGQPANGVLQGSRAVCLHIPELRVPDARRAGRSVFVCVCVCCVCVCVRVSVFYVGWARMFLDNLCQG